MNGKGLKFLRVVPRKRLLVVFVAFAVLILGLWQRSHIKIDSLRVRFSATTTVTLSSGFGLVFFDFEYSSADDGSGGFLSYSSKEADYQALFRERTLKESLPPFYKGLYSIGSLNNTLRSFQWRREVGPNVGQPGSFELLYIRFPVGLMLVLPGMGVGLQFLIGAFRFRRGRTGRCLACGYNLTGNRSGVCPECGEGVERRGEV